WGLLSGVAKGLRDSGSVDVAIVATNMHLEEKYGMTVREIEEDGFPVDARVPMPAASDSPLDTALATADCLAGIARALDRLRPDMLLILGDRYEMLAVATAATIMRVPIAHIAGGEISEGAIDDNIRHALTKLSSLHFTATEAYRNRVISMGEDSRFVFNTGALGVYNIEHDPVVSREELEDFIGMTVGANTLLVTLHPATCDTTPVGIRCQALLDALDTFRRNKIVFTYPNNDPQGAVIIDMINAYAARNPDRVAVVPSLGRTRYLSLLHYVAAVVGNSSSGIVEVPSLHIPTVDIGIRQRGRIAAPSVIHCDADADSIREAILFALSPAGRRVACESANPYHRPDTLSRIIDVLTSIPLSDLATKRFVDPCPIQNQPAG
ncbi:MAG: UDP-N-acetylglucosamine 2-epimerase (hydrolyzing), partial [Muribaculaceae bacterium]|nr:UDP-N-acetylglucosamine 2-epimerase (hydrolyzing) [Muribaculaceae bacterium]